LPLPLQLQLQLQLQLPLLLQLSLLSPLPLLVILSAAKNPRISLGAPPFSTGPPKTNPAANHTCHTFLR